MSDRDSKIYKQVALIIASGAAAGGVIYYAWKLRNQRTLAGPTDELKDRVVVVTGANTGVGKQVAKQLAAKGATVILGCRSVEKGEEAAAYIRKVTGNTRVKNRQVDVSSFSSIRAFVDTFKGQELHVLINNAGLMSPDRVILGEDGGGGELCFVTNYLGPFYLTQLLLPTLKQSALKAKQPSRIVNISSRLEKNGTWDLLDYTYTGENEYTVWKGYANSKLCNLLYTYALHQRLVKENGGKEENLPVTVNAATPGFVRTDLGRWTPWRFYLSTLPVRLFVSGSAAKGAETITYVASSDEEEVKGVSGQFFGDMAKENTSVLSYDEGLQKQLWDLSMRLTKLKK